MNPKRLVTFLSAGLFSLGILSGCQLTDSNPIQMTSPFVFEEQEHDFGLLQQSGGIVSHDFSFTYQGTEPITVTGTPASCACTTGEINKTVFQPGESGTLTVRFNPNLHAEPPGRFYKTVSILTEPALNPLPEVKIWQEIDLDLGEEAFESNQGSSPKSSHEDHHDDD